jgi:DNA-directed RNA polymerase subunit alpha
MTVLQENWKDLIFPNLINVEYKDKDKKNAVITVEPLERGYGVTIGNALRRVLLSSIKGFAVTSVKIDGVLHEYSTIDGVREDVLDIIMNIKSLIINKPTPSPATLYLKLNKKGQILAKDIVLSGGVEILNPELVICNVEDTKINLNIEMVVSYGKGYSLTEEKENDEKEVSVIYLDTLFSPVKRVSYTVENARIGQHTDYDKLILSVETDGVITPEDAIGIAAKILQSQLEAFIGFDVVSVEKNSLKQKELSNNSTSSDINPDLFKKIDEMELSVRSYNCLINEGIKYIADLVRKSEADMLKLPNFGRKSLNELRENLKVLGLSFDMKIENWPPENLVELSKKKKE